MPPKYSSHDTRWSRAASFVNALTRPRKPAGPGASVVTRARLAGAGSGPGTSAAAAATAVPRFLDAIAAQYSFMFYA